MDSFPFKIILFFFLILLSAVFSSSETAFFSLRRKEIEDLVDQGDRFAKRVLDLLNFPRRLLITILTGNTIVNISLGVLSASIAHDVASSFSLSEVWIILIEVVAITFTILIFGETIPKVMAIRMSSKYSLRISGFVKLVYWILKPLTEVFFYFTEYLTKLFNVKKESLFNTEEDFYTLVELGEKEGAIKSKEKDMIKSLVKFSDTVVREVMVPRPDIYALDSSLSVKEIIEKIQHEKYSRYPIYENDIDNIIGFIFEKDLLRYLDGNKENVDAKKLLRPVLYIPENKSISLMLKEFQDKKTKIGIVVDEYGGTSGLITLEDVLEEILGELQDEKDQESSPIEWINKQQLVVNAGINLDDLSEVLRLEFPEDRNYDTLAGFVLEVLEKIPKKHDHFNYQNLTFIVDKMQKRRIEKIRIKL